MTHPQSLQRCPSETSTWFPTVISIKHRVWWVYPSGPGSLWANLLEVELPKPGCSFFLRSGLPQPLSWQNFFKKFGRLLYYKRFAGILDKLYEFAPTCTLFFWKNRPLNKYYMILTSKRNSESTTRKRNGRWLPRNDLVIHLVMGPCEPRLIFRFLCWLTWRNLTVRFGRTCWSKGVYCVKYVPIER